MLRLLCLLCSLWLLRLPVFAVAAVSLWPGRAAAAFDEPRPGCRIDSVGGYESWRARSPVL
jgi:hypothetical protein